MHHVSVSQHPFVTTIWLFIVFCWFHQPVCFGQGRTDNPQVETQVPTGTGGEFSTFENVSLNNQGKVVFSSDLQNVPAGQGTNGIYSLQTGAIEELVRSLQELPDGSGETFSGEFFSNFGCSKSGGVSFADSVLNGEAGIFRAGMDGVQIIARVGQTTPVGGELSNLLVDEQRTSINSAGQVAFNAISSTSLSNPFPAPDVFLFDSTGLLQLSADGELEFPFPQFSFVTCGSRNIMINELGQVAFIHCRSIDEPSNFEDHEFLILGSAVVENTFFSFAGIDELLESDVNQAGQIVFTATDAGEAQLAIGEGVIVSVPQTIVTSSTASPDGEGLFDVLRCPRINNSGDVAFQADMSNGIPGIYRTYAGQLQVVVRSGDPKPGIGTFEVGLAKPILNDVGTIGFQDGNGGIYLADNQDTVKVVEVGEPLFDGGPIITGLNINSNPVQGTGLNDLGQVAYIATSGSSQFIVQFTPDLHFRIPGDGAWEDLSAWTLGIRPEIQHDVYLDPEFDSTITGPLQEVPVRSLEVGGGTGIATLAMAGGTITPQFPTSVLTNGVVTGNGYITGQITLAGEVILGNLVFDDLVNIGTISGTGRLRVLGSMINGTTLDFNEQTNITVAGQLNNFEGFGVMQFEAGVVRVDSLVNDAEIFATSGTNHIFGDVDNRDFGLIEVAVGGNLTISENLNQNGSLVLENDGTEFATAVVFGDFSGAGGVSGGGKLFVVGNLSPGNSPGRVTMDGSLFLGSGTETLVELGGTMPGEFDQLIITRDLDLAGSLSVQLIDGFQLQTGHEFLIADVGGNLHGQFAGLDEGDLVGNFGGIDLFISYAGGDGNDVVLTTIRPSGSVFPESFLVTRGVHVSGGIGELAESDNMDLSLRRLNSDIQSRTEFEVKAVSPDPTPSSLEVMLEGSRICSFNRKPDHRVV